MYPLYQEKPKRVPWNKCKLTGQKPPLKQKEDWAIRIRLQIEAKHRDLTLFNLAIDSKLRACDLLKLKVSDVCHRLRTDLGSSVVESLFRRYLLRMLRP